MVVALTVRHGQLATVAKVVVVLGQKPDKGAMGGLMVQVVAVEVRLMVVVAPVSKELFMLNIL